MAGSLARQEAAATNQQFPRRPWCRSLGLIPSTKRRGSEHSSWANTEAREQSKAARAVLLFHLKGKRKGWIFAGTMQGRRVFCMAKVPLWADIKPDSLEEARRRGGRGLQSQPASGKQGPSCGRMHSTPPPRPRGNCLAVKSDKRDACRVHPWNPLVVMASGLEGVGLFPGAQVRPVTVLRTSLCGQEGGAWLQPLQLR